MMPLSEPWQDFWHQSRSRFCTYLAAGSSKLRQFLDRRGLQLETWQQWGFGLGPQTMLPNLHSEGRMLAERLIIPIRDESGQLVGLAGRALDESEPKFWHLPFDKRFVLWGLCENGNALLNNLHRPHTFGRCPIILVESYFDVLALADAGAPFGVAMMGSVLHKEQAALLVRYADRVVYIAHNDKLDIDSVRKVVDPLEAVGIAASCVACLAHKDFADYYAAEQVESVRWLTQQLALARFEYSPAQLLESQLGRKT